MDDIYVQFLDLIKAALNQRPSDLSIEDPGKLIRLFEAHGLPHFLFYHAQRSSEALMPDQRYRQHLKRMAFVSATKDATQDREMAEIAGAFSKDRLWVLPLKGYELKRLYPSSEMRHMSDTDLLIAVDQAEQVKICLERIGFVNHRFGQGSTDLYTSPTGLQYEIHRSLEEEGFNEQSQAFLKNLLSVAVPVPEHTYFLTLPHESHYAYILCHFVKHLLSGGIGIRQVMDIYLCRKKWTFDEEKLEKLLGELELREFAATVERLANHWFGDGEGDSVTEELGEYILGSGVFGKEEQKVADRMLKEKKKQSKLSYIWSRLFPSYQSMCFYYPILKKWAVLLPVFWLWRILYALIFRRGKLKREVSTVSGTDYEAVAQRAAFYRRCGLNVYSEYVSKK